MSAQDNQPLQIFVTRIGRTISLKWLLGSRWTTSVELLLERLLGSSRQMKICGSTMRRTDSCLSPLEMLLSIPRLRKFMLNKTVESLMTPKPTDKKGAGCVNSLPETVFKHVMHAIQKGPRSEISLDIFLHSSVAGQTSLCEG